MKSKFFVRLFFEEGFSKAIKNIRLRYLFDQLINIGVRVRFRPFWLENPLTMISACLLEAKLASTSQDLEPKNVRNN